MAKQQSTTTQNDEVKELVVDARFYMDSYDKTDKDGKKTDTVEFVAFELVDPFGDPDFSHITLKAKWDKYDDKNRLVKPDRVFDYMKYYAKKALRSAAEVPVKVTIKPVRYKSKHSGEMVTYPAMFAAPTFVELADERPVEVVIKGASNANIFGHLASRALGIKLTPREPDDDDAGLSD